jgi:hypothetical protein
MTQGKDVIYVNGDSFTEGCDIADHLYPNFNKNYSSNELLSIPFRQAIENQVKSIQEKADFGQMYPVENLGFLEYERTLRWSSVLETILNKPVLNLSSRGGSSMYAIAYKTIADVVALKDQGYNITDIIIQITAGGRFDIFKNTEDHEEPPGKSNILRYNITSANRHMSKYKDMMEHILSHETFEYSDYRVLHDMFMLKHALTALTNARIIFVDSLFYKKTISGDRFFTLNHCNVSNDMHIVKFKKQLDQEIELSMLECVEPDEPETMTTGMHFTAKVHELFAKKIAERYFQ